ncbi:hypothetical protein KUTeg_006587 [Tegillarca granosa]|uniref:Ankyrin repeat domain-containing protein 6 n=1 Tax=Tegillarca granosa TaxID=220873 RepID=A0ABQ9FAR0_TEGGR|nr:hypothetical protein KUTeg_006587 [Tegillarca granosa]
MEMIHLFVILVLDKKNQEMTSAQTLQNETSPATSIPIGSLEDKLRLAASKGQLDKVQELIQSGASFDPDKNGRTALHYAALNGHLEVCKFLAQKGCHLDDQDVAGCSPLHRAASQGHLEVISFLLGEGCNIDKQDEDGNAPVHEAAWNGFSKTLELLIKHNCNVGVVNKAGFTALHLACQNGHNESSRIILYAGINADLKNNYGDTALHTSARYGHAGVTRILISARSKLNEQNKNGDTALHIAAALKRRKIAKLVVEAGIDVSIKNKQNETAVEVARRKEHPEIIVIITSLNRPKTPTHHHHHVSHGRMPHKEVNFKDEITIDGPIVVPDEDAPIKPDSKQEKQKKFFFFKKKKKEKDKATDTKQVNQGKSPQQQQQQHQCATHSNVQGFFSQYVPRPGVQYYRDLAGNIKQGPIGYTPVCQCLPVIKKLEQKVDANKENIYDHIDASHKILKERLDQLDHRASQQVHALDKLTRERLQQEEHNCQDRINRRLEEENLHLMKHFNESNKFGVNEWLEAKLASYGHCLDHHHDDTALPSNNIFMDVHVNANGRLFRSRSDETLSQSDNHSGKFRKKDFYESRQAAMQQMRAWQVPQYNNRERERTRQGQIKQTHQYRASPRDISQNERKQMHTFDLQSPSTVSTGQSPNVQSGNDPVYMSKRDYQNQGAIPKRMPHSQTWHNAQEFQSPRQRESSTIVHSTPKSRESSPFEMASTRLVKSNTDGSGLNRFNQMRQSFPERGSANTNTSTINQTANLSSSAGQGPQQHEQSSTGGKVKPPVPAKPTLNTDRSISTPSNCSPYTQVSNSDYEVMNPVNKEYQEQVQMHIQNWYQRKVQEAAHRLREGPYNDVQDNGDHYDMYNRYNVHQNRTVQNQTHQQQNTRQVYMYGQQPQQQYHSNNLSDYQYLPSYVRGTDI